MNLIINSLLDGLYLLLAAVSNLFYFILPDATLPSSMTSSLVMIGSAFYPVSWVIEFNTLSICLFTISTVLSGLVIYRFIKFVVSVIPFL